jgi:CheY-like chemotaxis protein
MNQPLASNPCPDTSAIQANGYRLRVLVVEDHEDTAASTALVLRLYGHDVQVASDGRMALQLMDAQAPDVVLLDLGLPRMDGWEVAKQIRSQATYKRPLLVAISGYGREADRLRSTEAGIDLHLVKPIDPDQLKDLLARFQTVVVP